MVHVERKGIEARNRVVELERQGEQRSEIRAAEEPPLLRREEDLEGSLRDGLDEHLGVVEGPEAPEDRRVERSHESREAENRRRIDSGTTHCFLAPAAS
jgi:hypothetical protein